MIAMPRIHFVELHEQPRFPAMLRHEITDALPYGSGAFGFYSSISAMLQRALGVGRNSSIVDRCSGSGRPWLDLSRKLQGDTRYRKLLEDWFAEQPYFHEEDHGSLESVCAFCVRKRSFHNEIEKRTGLHCCYVSRVEHGHTVPAVETLEKFARALQVPMYQLFYDGEYPPELPNLPKRQRSNGSEWGSKGKDARLVAKFCHLFKPMEKDDLALVMLAAQKLAKRNAD